jgi:hypothetical protein
MATTAVTQLQQQIDEVRREAFAAGYAAAMQAIREVASRSAPEAGSTAAAPRRRGRARQAAPEAQPTRQRRVRAIGDTGGAPRSATRRPQRGTNARLIEEILQASVPRAVRPAEIRNALQDKGITMAFASIRHALGQLEARNAAEQVGDSKTWRHRGGAS